MSDLNAVAKEIAKAANECCYRSDGYEEHISELARERLKEAYLAGFAAAREMAAQLHDKWAIEYREIAAKPGGYTYLELAHEHIGSANHIRALTPPSPDPGARTGEDNAR